MRHVLGADLRRAADDLSVALEDQAGDLLEPAVVEVLHDLDDRLLSLADRDEVELIDESLRLAGRVWTSHHGQRFAAHLRRKRKRLVLHCDHAVDADHGRAQAVNLGQDLAPFHERVVDVADGVSGPLQRSAEVHEPQRRHDPVTSLRRSALGIHENDVCHLASCTLT